MVLVALVIAVVMIAVHMPLTPSPVDNHLSFVILLCIIFANYEDWRRVGGATCVICPSGWNDTHTPPTTTGIGDYAADLPTNENLRNSTIQFYTSLVPGANVTWYSNLLSILFWVHLASFCVRFIGAQCAAKRICCTTARLCARCTLSGAGILTMLVLHSCYERPSLDFW